MKEQILAVQRMQDYIEQNNAEDHFPYCEEVSCDVWNNHFYRVF